ncbi:MAG: hypothetical protein ACYDER_10230 [Ktedonobacteraceae bacterium]
MLLVGVARSVRVNDATRIGPEGFSSFPAGFFFFEAAGSHAHFGVETLIGLIDDPLAITRMRSLLLFRSLVLFI